MTTVFNPLDHPAILRTPARLSDAGGGQAHIPFLFFLISALRPRLLVELGTTDGDTYCALCQAVSEERLPTRCFAVADWPDATQLADLRAYHHSRYGNFSQLLPSVLSVAPGHIADGTLDLLHLAGPVTPQVLAAWWPKLSTRGMVLVSEINSTASALWTNLKGRYRHLEFPHAEGLGLLALGEPETPALAALLLLPGAQAEQIRACFAQLGQAVLQWRELFRHRAATQQRQTELLREKLARREQRLQSLQTLLHLREEELQRINTEVLGSDAWWMVNRMWALRRVVLPPGTRRERLLKISTRYARILSQFGVRGTAQKLLARAQRRYRPVDADSYVDGRTLNLMRTRPAIALPELHLPVLETAAEQAPTVPGSTVSVVIPTLNAGAEFSVLLAALTGQRGCEGVELIVVDSGSSDQTVMLARAAGARVIEIPAAEFTHAHARNLGAQAATGAYLLFMVQDALPASPLWLAELVTALQQHQAVAVSSVEAAREDADLLARVLNQTHYRMLGADAQDRVLERPAATDYQELRRNCQLCNVACLIERAVFLRYGLRGTYAEDLDLGMRLVRDGHRLVLLNSSKVVHSHNRPAYYHLKRSYVDSVALAALFADFPKPPAIEAGRLGQESLAVLRLQTQLFAQAQTQLTAPQSFTEFEGTLLGDLQDAYDNPAAELGEFDASSDAYTEFIARLAARADAPGSGQLGASAFAAAVRDALFHTLQYLKGLHEVIDAELLASLRECMEKAHALQLGSFLASSLAAGQADTTVATWVDDELRKGV